MINVKVLVGAFNQEKVLVEGFSVIVKTDCFRWIVCSSSLVRRGNEDIGRWQWTILPASSIIKTAGSHYEGFCMIMTLEREDNNNNHG